MYGSRHRAKPIYTSLDSSFTAHHFYCVPCKVPRHVSHYLAHLSQEGRFTLMLPFVLDAIPATGTVHLEPLLTTSTTPTITTPTITTTTITTAECQGQCCIGPYLSAKLGTRYYNLRRIPLIVILVSLVI